MSFMYSSQACFSNNLRKRESVIALSRDCNLVKKKNYSGYKNLFPLFQNGLRKSFGFEFKYIPPFHGIHCSTRGLYHESEEVRDKKTI